MTRILLTLTMFLFLCSFSFAKEEPVKIAEVPEYYRKTLMVSNKQGEDGINLGELGRDFVTILGMKVPLDNITSAGKVGRKPYMLFMSGKFTPREGAFSINIIHDGDGKGKEVMVLIVQYVDGQLNPTYEKTYYLRLVDKTQSGEEASPPKDGKPEN